MRRHHIAGATLESVVSETTQSIQHQMESRAVSAANALRNEALEVLRGQRSGRRYKVPGTYKRQRDPHDGKMKNGRFYTASAPGEPPAVRTGNFRRSWQSSAHVVFGSYISRIESDVMTDNGKYNLGELLENGTSRMAPRPYQDAIMERAKPKILRIYDRPYFRGGST